MEVKYIDGTFGALSPISVMPKLGAFLLIRAFIIASVGKRLNCSFTFCPRLSLRKAFLLVGIVRTALQSVGYVRKSKLLRSKSDYIKTFGLFEANFLTFYRIANLSKTPAKVAPFFYLSHYTYNVIKTENYWTICLATWIYSLIVVSVV